MNARVHNHEMVAELQVCLSSRPYPAYRPAPRPSPAQG
jgi:hypothetical protein